MGFKVILTGATGMVGEGVLLECLQQPLIDEVLVVGRKHYDLQHPKLKELVVPDFFQLDQYAAQVSGYDACFFCAGVSSVGMKEDKYTYITYDTTMAFARSLVSVNPGMVFCYVTGAHTDSSEKGKVMWARVKGRTENALTQLPFKAAYNFRPGAMLPVPGQKNANGLYKFIAQLIKFFAPRSVLSLSEVGRAMLHTLTRGYAQPVLEIKDIRALAQDK